MKVSYKGVCYMQPLCGRYIYVIVDDFLILSTLYNNGLRYWTYATILRLVLSST